MTVFERVMTVFERTLVVVVVVVVVRVVLVSRWPVERHSAQSRTDSECLHHLLSLILL